jgi:23S rRNA (adenine1618-N6)-methyltransferase
MHTWSPGNSLSLSSDYDKSIKFNWKDKGAVLALTKALLKDSFQVDVDMKEDGYLCPTIPNRTNYLCYLSDLLQCSPLDPRRNQSAERTTVLDIGTGPYAIYAVLGG